MKKYDVMGHTMIKLSSLGYAIRKGHRLAEMFYSGEQLEAAEHALDNVVRQVYLDELRGAKTDEEREAVVLEIPGDFMVYRIADGVKRKFDFFQEFSDGRPVVTLFASRAMKFDYESKAKEVAKELGEGWEVWDLCNDAHEDTAHILDMLFRDGEETV